MPCMCGTCLSWNFVAAGRARAHARTHAFCPPPPLTHQLPAAAVNAALTQAMFQSIYDNSACKAQGRCGADLHAGTNLTGGREAARHRAVQAEWEFPQMDARCLAVDRGPVGEGPCTLQQPICPPVACVPTPDDYCCNYLTHEIGQMCCAFSICQPTQ